jgi:hypothetical protein
LFSKKVKDETNYNHFFLHKKHIGSMKQKTLNCVRHNNAYPTEKCNSTTSSSSLLAGVHEQRKSYLAAKEASYSLDSKGTCKTQWITVACSEQFPNTSLAHTNY